MATELLQPGVSVFQEFRTVSPTIVTPTLVPCAVAPAFQVIEAYETDSTGNRVVNTDALAAVPAILTADNAGDYSGLDGLILKVQVNGGAIQEFTFSDPTSLDLTALEVKDQINASDPAPVGFSPYVVTDGSNEYLQLRSTNTGTGQTLTVLNGDANSILGFADNFTAEGVSSYRNYDVHIEQTTFPDPRSLGEEMDVDESSIRVFLNTGAVEVDGTTRTPVLKEIKDDESFLRRLKGATYTGGTVTYGSFNAKKFAFKYKRGDTTHEYTFASEPGNIADLVSAMNTLTVALTGLEFVANGSVIDAKSDHGYFEVVAPSADSTHANMGWTNGAKAYTVETVDDGDGDAKTPYIIIDQEDYTAPADAAVLTGSVHVAAPLEIHNKTFIASIDGGIPQTLTFDAGPIIAGAFAGGNTLDGEDFDFTVNGTAKSVTFSGTDPIAIGSIITQINAAAGLTVCYEGNASGVPTPGGGRLCFQVGGGTVIPGGNIQLDWDAGYTNQWTDLGLTPGADIVQTMTLAEVVTFLNATFGAGVAADASNHLELTSPLTSVESKVAIGDGSANTDLGFTDGQYDEGAPYAPIVGDAVYVDGSLIGYITVVSPAGYVNRLKLDREVALTFTGYAYYIEAKQIVSTALDRPTPDLVIDALGAVNLKQDILRDSEGIPISTATAALIIAYKALRLDVTPAAAEPSLLSIDDTTALESALSPLTTDNPLGLMLYYMSINAPGINVAGIGVDETSTTNPDGTAEAYSRALTFLEAQEVYALAPASQDPNVHQLFVTHVDDMSDPDAKGERIVFINPEMPGEGVPTMVNSGTDGDSTGVTNEFDTKLASLSVDVVAAGLDPTNLEADDGLYLDIATNSKRYSISAISGSVVSIRVAFSAGENDDDFYAETNLPSTLISEAFTIYVRGADLVDSNGDPDYDAIAQAYQDLGKTYSNRRVVMTAPEFVGATIESTEQKIKGYYLNAAIAGMVGQQPPQQGFTNFPVSGFTRVFGSNDVFSSRQMNVGAAGGTYWVVQEVAGGALTSRHQLTTDLTSIETRELSITKVVDFTAKFMRAGLRNFIGKFNITQPFLDTLSTVVQGQLSFLTESGVLIGGDLNNIVQDEDAPDTVLIDVTLDVPYPCNYIRLTLVV